MKKSHFLILVFGIIAIIAITLFFYYFIYLSYISEEVREGCEVIMQNGGKDKVDIVFLTDNVQEKKAERFANFLLESEPFSSHKEKFNFFYAGKASCSIFNGIHLFCYSGTVLKNSAVCPNDYIIVLADFPREIRSTAYGNVMSININHPDEIILHEFGHSFANLADEYVPSTIPRGAKNCQEKCGSFDIGGCFAGCSEDSYFRSSESSVMRNIKTNEYRELNTRIIEKILEKYE